MKKHQLVAALGTLALAVNLLVPGFTFAADQTGRVTVSCGNGTGPSITTTPTIVTFQGKQASASAQDTYDAFLDDILNGGVYPKLGTRNMIAITDTRSYDPNCEVLTPGWTLTASATDLTSGATTAIIPKETIRIITTNESISAQTLINGTLYEPQVIGETVSYETNSDFTRDVTAPVLYDDADKDPATANREFATKSSYDSFGNANLLGSAVTLLSKTAGQNGSVATDVLLMIDQGIAAYQPAATYTATITYSVNAR